MAGVDLQVPSHALPPPPQQEQQVGCAPGRLQPLQPLSSATEAQPTHAAAALAGTPLPAPTYRVGCALLPKKVSRYLTTSMRGVASQQGVELVQIDYTRPLLEQGTFDAIIHKLRPNKEWERNLLEYCQVHPQVSVIDSVSSISTLHNRATMLTPLQGEGVRLNGGVHHPSQTVQVQAPHQVEILEGTTLEEAQRMLQEANLTPPLLVKPLWTDGREGSHGLGVLHDMQALGRLLSGQVSRELQPPLVVQQFVEHGGVLFKVYVLGDKTVVSRRPSLGDKYLGQEARRQGILQLPRISCKSVYAQQQHPQQHSAQAPQPQPAAGAATDSQQPTQATPQPALQPPQPLGSSQPATTAGDAPQGPRAPAAPAAPQGLGSLVSGIPCAAITSALSTFPLPPEWVTHSLATVLRQRLGLQLFNFDLIRPEQQPGAPDRTLYYVIDINYFPGVDKIPNFEHVFVAFLKQACARRGRLQQHHSGSVEQLALQHHHLQHQGEGGRAEGMGAERKSSGKVPLEACKGEGAGALGVGEGARDGLDGALVGEEDDGEPHVEVVEEVDEDEEDVEGSSTEDGVAPAALAVPVQQQGMGVESR